MDCADPQIAPNIDVVTSVSWQCHTVVSDHTLPIYHQQHQIIQQSYIYHIWAIPAETAGNGKDNV